MLCFNKHAQFDAWTIFFPVVMPQKFETTDLATVITKIIPSTLGNQTVTGESIGTFKVYNYHIMNIAVSKTDSEMMATIRNSDSNSSTTLPDVNLKSITYIYCIHCIVSNNADWTAEQ